MKYLFLLLVLANVVVFVGWMRVPAPEMVPEQAPERALTADVIVLEPVADPQRAAARDDGASVVGEHDTCLRLGPFYSSTIADQARAWAGNRDMSYLQVPGQETFKVGDWVYLPPLESRDRAVARAQELRDTGIDDIYVVASDEFRNAIALGLYSTERGVRQRLEYLNQMGIEAQVHERTRTRETINLYLWSEQSPGEGELPGFIKDEGAALEAVDCQRIETLHERAAISYNTVV